MNELVKINGKSLEIRYDFKALINMERLCGKSMSKFFAEDVTGDDAKLESVCMFLLAGVGKQVKDLDEMIDLINEAVEGGQSLEDVMKPFMEAVERSSLVGGAPSEEEGTEDEKKPSET